MEIARHVDWAKTSAEQYHYRGNDVEVDIILESLGGGIVAIETKAAATVKARDYRHSEVHLANIYRKIGGKNRTEATRYAYQQGLVETPLYDAKERPATSSPIHSSAVPLWMFPGIISADVRPPRAYDRV